MAKLKVSKHFDFEAAHFLPHYHGKCERLHGHSYKLIVTVEGEVDPHSGMVIDFVILKKIVKERIIEKLDHYLLNDFMENPTAENTVVWMWEQLTPFSEILEQENSNNTLPEEAEKIMKDSKKPHKKSVPTDVKLIELKLWETATSWVTYTGE